VQAENGFHRKTAEQPVFDHRPCAASALLSRLKNEKDIPVEIGRFPAARQKSGRSKQHGDMTVVATPVFQSRISRTVGQIALFFERQRVHIRAQTDTSARISSPQYADDAGFRQSAMHFKAAGFEFARNNAGCPRLFEREFGMRVDISPKGDDFLKKGNFDRFHDFFRSASHMSEH
jgi:hypothetical protein